MNVDAGARTRVFMDTFVTIEVVGHDQTPADRQSRDEAIDAAFDWFQEVESRCTRFDDASELVRLSRTAGVPVEPGPIVFKALEFACVLAEETGGAFDPVVGHLMTARGFNRNYQTGEKKRPTFYSDGDPGSYRDVHIDSERQVVTLARPLMLDLGAVAKGLAIDLAAEALRPFRDFAIDAGGDVYLSGCGRGGRPWRVGIRHPRDRTAILETLEVSDVAVCTSGDYERRGSGDETAHHLLDPRTEAPATSAVSATVVAPSAMLADALGTAAFVLGPRDGLALLEHMEVDGLIVSSAMERLMTAGMSRVVLSHA